MRIYVEPSDQLLIDINKAVKEKGIGKSQIILEALDQYLHGTDLAEIGTLKNDLMSVQKDLDHAKDTINQKDSEITFLHSHVAQLTQLALPNHDHKPWYKFW